MKTTVEISDALFREARREARRQGTTLRALIEAGLRTVLRPEQRKVPFKLRSVTFKGEGLQEPGSSWERLRDLAYEGRGA